MQAYVLLAALLCLAGAPASAEERAVTEAEPTLEVCMDAVAKARGLIETLPADHLSRYFAERILGQALAEAGNREYDECLEFAESAFAEARDKPHVLAPGDVFKVLRADEH